MIRASFVYYIALFASVIVQGHGQTKLASASHTGVRGSGRERFLQSSSGLFCGLLEKALGSSSCTCDKQGLAPNVNFACQVQGTTLEGKFQLNPLRGVSTGSTGICAGNFTFPSAPRGSANSTARAVPNICVLLDFCGRNSPSAGFCGCSVTLGAAQCTSCSLCAGANGTTGISFSCSAHLLTAITGIGGNRPSGFGTKGNCIPLPTLGGVLGGGSLSSRNSSLVGGALGSRTKSPGGGILSGFGNRGSN